MRSPRSLLAAGTALTLAAGAFACAAGASSAHRGPRPPARGGPTTSSYSETHFGLTCVWASGRSAATTCSRADGTGLHVTVSQRLVTVQSVNGKVLFARLQSRRSRRPAPQPTASVAFSHSDGNVLCQWSTANGGGALCRTADGRGYTVGVLSTVAVVISDASDIVFIGKQP
jgi:hypothetical protein